MVISLSCVRQLLGEGGRAGGRGEGRRGGGMEGKREGGQARVSERVQGAHPYDRKDRLHCESLNKSSVVCF